MTTVNPAAPLTTFEKAKRFFSWFGGLLARAICIVDDIPLLLLKNTGVVGPFLLVGAGFLIFPVSGISTIFEIIEARDQFTIDQNEAIYRARKAAAASKIALAIVGLLVSAALLAFILTHLVVLEAVASIAIPAIMTVISGVELISAVGDLQRAKREAALNPTPENLEKVVDAKRDLIFSTSYFGMGLAITALATLSVLTGLGVLTFGFVPAAVLVGVVALALAVKIFEIVDENKGHKFTNAIRTFFTGAKPQVRHTEGYQPIHDNMPNIHQHLGATSLPPTTTPAHLVTGPITPATEVVHPLVNSPESPKAFKKC